MVVLEKIKNKRTQGRQKIEIKKLEKKSNKQVTFSKRRSGIFKKAGELSLLCGSEVAVIVFSPNGKLFCFGHPSVDVVIRRYLHGTSTTSTAVNTATTNLTESADMANGGEFNMRTYVEAVKELEAEKKRVAEAKKQKEGKFRGDGDARDGAWWDDEVDGMGVEELEQYMAALSELRKKVASKVQDLMMVKGGSPLPMASFREGNGRLGFGLENGSF